MEQDKEWTLSFNVKHWFNKPLNTFFGNDLSGYCESKIVLPSVWNSIKSTISMLLAPKISLLRISLLQNVKYAIGLLPTNECTYLSQIEVDDYMTLKLT